LRKRWLVQKWAEDGIKVGNPKKLIFDYFAARSFTHRALLQEVVCVRQFL